MSPTSLSLSSRQSLGLSRASARVTRRGPSGAMVAPLQPSLLRRAVPRTRRGRSLSARAELDQVDPMTGEIVNSPARAPLASNSIEVNGLTWAYRTGEVDEAAAKGVSSGPVVLCHGIGSSSYSYRETIELMAAQGVEVYAPDFPGHGASSKPSPSSFAYDEAAYTKAFGDFIEAAPFKKPIVLVVQGFILAQYALLWAAENPELVERMVILNTPLSPKTKLPPYLSPYKNPIAFMRPKGIFAADMHNAGGSAYVMQGRDAEIYMQPYVEDNGANEALAASIEQCDLKALVTKVDEAYRTWRGDTMVLFAGADSYIQQQSAFDFLETKRTNIKIASFEAKVGHMPQEDFPEILAKRLFDYLMGVETKAVAPGTRIPGNFTDSDSA